MEDSPELIHADLAEEAGWGINSLYTSWSESNRIDPFMVVWPSETVIFNGESVNDAIPFQLPLDKEQQRAFIKKAVKKTKAWAVLLVEQRAEAVVAVFESPVGTRSWHLPIKRRGDVLVLTDAKEYENTDYVGAVNSRERQQA